MNSYGAQQDLLYRQMMERAWTGPLPPSQGRCGAQTWLITCQSSRRSSQHCIAALILPGMRKLAVRRLQRSRGNYRFAGTTLYVTWRPCPMCAALLVHAGSVDRYSGPRPPELRMWVSIPIGTMTVNHAFTVTAGFWPTNAANCCGFFFEADVRFLL